MNRNLAFAVVLQLSLVAIGNADEWSSLERTQFYSASRSHMLEIEPHPDWPDKPGHCRATLFRGDEQVWSRHLINNYGPVQVFVADSGNYVITMDEWGSVGELPVVIYGRRGELIRVHSTDSLGLEDDVEHIQQSISSYWWNQDAISFFGPEEKTFFIHLHWGKLLLLHLESGDLMDDEWYGIARGWLMPEEKWKALHEFGDARIQNERLKAAKPAARKGSAGYLWVLLPLIPLVVGAIWYYRRRFVERPRESGR